MGFFGLVIKPGELEAVEVPDGWRLQLCSAVIQPLSSKKSQPSAAKEPAATLWIEPEADEEDVEAEQYLIARLQGLGYNSQTALTHSISSVDGKVLLEVKGTGAVHVTGYFTQDFNSLPSEDSDMGSSEDEDEVGADVSGLNGDGLGAGKGKGDDEDDSDEEEEEEEEDAKGRRHKGASAGGVKAKGNVQGRNGRAKRASAVSAERTLAQKGGNAPEGEESEDDDDYSPDEDDEDEGDGEEDGEEEDEDDEEDGEDDEVDDAAEAVKPKRAPSGKDETAATGRPAKRSRTEDAPSEAKKDGADAVGDGSDATSKKERRRQRHKENKKKAEEAKRALDKAFASGGDGNESPLVGVPLKSPRSKTLKGGLKITDTTLGGGKEAVPGKSVKILYEGCFPNGKVFDKNENRRNPFKFRLGMKQVIVGMDRGLEGMRVGGTREIAIPSALGYGARKTGPIPANQDLVFKVELLDVLGK